MSMSCCAAYASEKGLSYEVNFWNTIPYGCVHGKHVWFNKNTRPSTINEGMGSVVELCK